MSELSAKEVEKIKEIAWVVCNVADCDGTRRHPCKRHFSAAETLWRDVTAQPKS